MAIVATSQSKRLLEAIRELADYLGEDAVATAFNVGNSFFTAAEKWRCESPRHPADIATYYSTTTSLMHQLVFANYGIQHETDLIEKAGQIFKNCQSMLDLGGGIGSFLLSINCRDSVHADLAGPLIEYASYRYLQNDLPVEIVELDWDYVHGDPFNGRTFDGVVCTEVLEHCPNPDELVEFLAKVVKPGGKLLATVSFDDGEGMVPQHLNVNRWTNESFISEVFPRWFDAIDENLYVRHVTE